MRCMRCCARPATTCAGCWGRTPAGASGGFFRPWPGSAADDAQRVGGAVIDEEGLCPCNRWAEAEVCRAELNFAEPTTENLNSER